VKGTNVADRPKNRGRASTTAGVGGATKNRHDEIVEAAARIFCQKGFDAASIEDVGAEVGILKGSLYYYIDSKEDLLFQVIEPPHNAMLESLERARSASGDTIDRIRDFIVTNVEANVKSYVRSTVFHRDFRSLSEARRKMIIDARNEYERFLRKLLEAGQTEGTVRAELDPTITAAAILSMTNGIYSWYRPDGARSGPEIAWIFADLAIHAIRRVGSD
jgi:AcrR family transcriptional regulator